MVVFDVIVKGKVIETIQPTQKLMEMYRFMISQIKELKVKYGSNFEICRRVII